MSLLMSKFNQKIIFEWLGSSTNSSIYKEDIEVPSLYNNDIKQYDYTEIQLPEVKL